MKNKICLIGYGYWGKILEKNLRELGLADITIIDENLKNLHLLNENYEFYFVATPVSSHLDILKKICKYKGKKIWCEKPLVLNLDEANYLYLLAESNSTSLFVDWTYVYNSGVNFLKEKLKEFEISQVILNRTNDGPERKDCDSRWDLSSHDLSIIFHIFGDIKPLVKWNEFSLIEQKFFGSNLSSFYDDKFQIIINSSWQQQTKNRTSIFITEDLRSIIMDDLSKKIILDGEIIYEFSEFSPLKNSISVFLRNDPVELEYNKNLTLKITYTLDDKI